MNTHQEQGTAPTGTPGKQLGAQLKGTSVVINEGGRPNLTSVLKNKSLIFLAFDCMLKLINRILKYLKHSTFKF